MSETSDPLGFLFLSCGLAFILISAVAVVIVLMTSRSQRQRRDAQAAAAWQALLGAAQAMPEAYMCYVEQIYQQARRGSKGVVVWQATGQRQDTWFWYSWPMAGSTLLVSGTTGYGPHNNNPNVMYVEHGGVLAHAPPGAQAAWHRLAQAVQNRADELPT